MISILHLLWICPFCFILSLLTISLCKVSKESEIEKEAYEQGFINGKNSILDKNSIVSIGDITLGELFTNNYDYDYELFIRTTGGLIYDIDEDNQLRMLFIDSFDELIKYFDNYVVFIDRSTDYSRPIIRKA